MKRIKFKKILPREFRYWLRGKKTQKEYKQVNRQRRQVVERLIANKNLTHVDRNPINHILFIVIDCLRNDHVSHDGYTRKTTPFLDKVAEQGSVFHDAISPSCWTYPAVQSLLSGLYPHHHGGIFKEDLRDIRDGTMPQEVRENVLFLPEILGNFGYITYIGSVLATVDLSLKGRFQQGFFYHMKNAAFVFRRYLRWLRTQRKRKTFAYLQLGDLHTRIRVSDPYRSVFGPIPNIPQLERFDYYQGDVMPGEPAFEHYRENRLKLYDAALFYVDEQIRRCFRRLKELKLLDDMLVVITADHGEELWDHMLEEKEHFFDPRSSYGVAHGHHLWQELLRVPLLLWGRGISAHEVYQRVTLVDVMPTILQLCGIRGWESLHVDGQDLLDSINKRVILAEDVALGYEKKAVFEEQYKLYYSQGDGIKWIFDLKNDPYEKRPLELPEVADRLMEFLPEAKKEGKEKKLSVDEETKSRLRDLGYLE